MKPATALLKELERARDAEEFSSAARAAYTVSIELLQAWLREAHKELDLALAEADARALLEEIKLWTSKN